MVSIDQVSNFIEIIELLYSQKGFFAENEELVFL